jgi:hypothetical protein
VLHLVNSPRPRFCESASAARSRPTCATVSNVGRPPGYPVLEVAQTRITATMTTLVLPGDALPLPTPAPSTTLHLHLGPGTAQSTPRTREEEDDDASTLYVARKMGPLQTSNKRRKVRDGGSEVQTRVWVDVEAKRVSRVVLLSVSL